jgi:dTDP-4-dehydrorhamnose 3,5-epimerase
MFCAEDLAAAGWGHAIAQINHSLTLHVGSVRGLHYQRPPHAEMKLVSCLHGAVWDVAVDLRPDSPSYLRWHAEPLSAENGCAMLIPPGFAHGFQALTDHAELLYCHTAAYAPAAEAGLHPLDPSLAIDWPLPLSEMSPRDAGHAWLTPEFEGVRL